MKKGKIIVIEGTDCSGKETQTKKLVERLNKEGIPTYNFSFPAYSTPTGKIIGLPYLGKSYLGRELLEQFTQSTKEVLKKNYTSEYNEKLIDDTINLLIDKIGFGWFPETAPNVDAKISSALFAIDRAYNIHIIEELLTKGNVIIDRYFYSNLAHQGGKIKDKDERRAFYEWDQKLEFEMFGLPESDIRIFLHVPTEYTGILKNNREEKLDENERDKGHLHNAEIAYLDVAKQFDFSTINCIKSQSSPINISDLKTPDEIHEEIYKIVLEKL